MHRLQRFFLYSICFHLFLLLFTVAASNRLPKPSPKKIVLREVKLAKPVKQTTHKVSARPTKKRTETKTKQKQKQKQKPIQAKRKPQPSRKSKETVSNKSKDIYQELEKKLEQVSKRQKSISYDKKVSVPVEIKLPSVAASPQEKIENKNFQMLTNFLRDHLSLPRGGRVKVQLSIDQFGKITHLKVLETTSEMNEHYLKKSLKDLTFPHEIRNTENISVIFVGRE